MHNKYLPTAKPTLTSEGQYSYHYSSCPSCPLGRTPNYRPPDAHQWDQGRADNGNTIASGEEQTNCTQEIQPVPITNPKEVPIAECAYINNPIDGNTTAIGIPVYSQPPSPPPTPTTPQYCPDLPETVPPISIIMKTKMPLYKHIPTYCRKTVPDALVRTLDKVVSECSGSNSEEAFALLCLFPSAVLHVEPGKGTNRATTSVTAALRKRLDLWEKKKYLTLWNSAASTAGRLSH